MANKFYGKTGRQDLQEDTCPIQEKGNIWGIPPQAQTSMDNGHPRRTVSKNISSQWQMLPVQDYSQYYLWHEQAERSPTLFSIGKSRQAQLVLKTIYPQSQKQQQSIHITSSYNTLITASNLHCRTQFSPTVFAMAVCGTTSRCSKQVTWWRSIFKCKNGDIIKRGRQCAARIYSFYAILIFRAFHVHEHQSG